jgi:hypothetical protein
VLTESGIVRRDIRSSFGAASGMAEGVPTTLTLTLLNSQIALPRDVCSAVYRTARGYSASATNLGRVIIDSDASSATTRQHRWLR